MTTEYHDYVVEYGAEYYAVPIGFASFTPEGEVIREQDEDGNDVVPESLVYLTDDETEAYRILALRLDIDDWQSHMAVRDGKYPIVTSGDREWYVLSDYEADCLWDDTLESYIDNCMEIPKGVEPYFDREKWKRDARIDGRGHAISSYDGNEYRVSTNHGAYFLYRLN